MSDTLDAPIQTAAALGYGGGLTMSDYPPGIVPPSPARASPDRAAASSPPPQKISKTQYAIGTPVLGDPTTWGQKRSADDLVKFWSTEGGMTPIAAQGIARRVQKESGFYPMALGDHGASFGTYQHQKDRLEAMKKYTAENGLDINDGHTQDLFSLQETKTDPKLQAMVLKLNAARTPEEAEKIWTEQFEKPAAFTPNMPYAPTAWDEGKLAMGNQFLSQMMREFGEGKERVAKIDRDYKPIKVEEQPKVPDPDPLKAFGSFASLFAMVAAGFSKTPAVAAMNGMAGAISAAKEHDWEQYAAQFKAWKTNTDLAHQAHEQHSKDVHDALEMMTHNIGAGRAMLESVSALARDEQMSRHLANQDYEGGAKLQMQRDEHDLAMQKAKPEAEAALMLTAAQGNLDAAMKTGNQEQIDTAKSNYDAAMQHYREIRQAPYAGRAANITAQEESALVSRWRSEYQEREGHPPSADDETAYRLRLRGKEDPTVTGARKDRAEDERKRHTLRVEELAANRDMSANERAAANLDERVKHDRAMEGKDHKTAHEREVEMFEGDIRKDPKFAGVSDSEVRSEANRRITASKKPEEQHLTPDALDMEAKQLLMTGQMPSLGFGGATARVQVINRAAELAAEQGHTMGDYIAGRATWKADVSSLGQITKISDAVVAFENTALDNMKVVEALMNKGAGTSAGPVVNRWFQAGRRATGDPDVAALDTAMGTVASEYGKVMSGGSASIAATPEGARNDAKEWLDKIQSPEAIAAQFKVARQDMGNRKNRLLGQRSDIQRRISEGINAPPPDTAPPAEKAPTVPGGRWAPDGKEYVPDPKRPNKYLEVVH